MPETTRVFHYDQVEWDDPLSSLAPEQRPPKEIVEKALAGIDG